MEAIDVIKNPPKLITKSIDVINREQAREEAVQLLISYAQDVVDFWPLMTLRTIRVMITKMASLKEALELLRGQDRKQS
jgi:hypothetical protein